jgi:hypothetical protein
MFFVFRIPSFSQSYDIKIIYKIRKEILKIVSIELERTDVTVEQTKGGGIMFVFENVKLMCFIILKIGLKTMVCIKVFIEVIDVIISIIMR